jgi:hypothetical protein
MHEQRLNSPLYGWLITTEDVMKRILIFAFALALVQSATAADKYCAEGKEPTAKQTALASRVDQLLLGRGISADVRPF